MNSRIKNAAVKEAELIKQHPEIKGATTQARQEYFAGLRKIRNKKILIGFFGGMWIVWALACLLSTFLAVNVSASLPEWGWFRYPFNVSEASEFKLGDRVEHETPFDSGPINSVKIISGLPGQMITVDAERNVFVDSRLIGQALTETSTGKPLSVITQGAIPPDHFFMAATHTRSFDSRYGEVGLIPLSDITARVYPLPDIPWLGLDGPLMSEEDWLARISDQQQVEEKANGY